jgi:hypothetical protein
MRSASSTHKALPANAPPPPPLVTTPQIERRHVAATEPALLPMPKRSMPPSLATAQPIVAAQAIWSPQMVNVPFDQLSYPSAPLGPPPPPGMRTIPPPRPDGPMPGGQPSVLETQIGTYKAGTGGINYLPPATPLRLAAPGLRRLMAAMEAPPPHVFTWVLPPWVLQEEEEYVPLQMHDRPAMEEETTVQSTATDLEDDDAAEATWRAFITSGAGSWLQVLWGRWGACALGGAWRARPWDRSPKDWALSQLRLGSTIFDVKRRAATFGMPAFQHTVTQFLDHVEFKMTAPRIPTTRLLKDL